MRLRGPDRREPGRRDARNDGEARRLKRVPLEDSFDLHSFRPEDVVSVVGEYLALARAAGFREVRLIHGKGVGVRRAAVRRLLAARPDVKDFFDAPPERGGTGATIVVLGED
ncbi:MAG TPA: Smr/MutS family protein [Thermoanaerobaculia bacterium]|nr:Smr/MutS family protein [Thermoanaerobaculia bacterium]